MGGAKAASGPFPTGPPSTAVTGRRLLLALALVATGVLIGLPAARLISPPQPVADRARPTAPAPAPAPAEPTPVEIGDGDETAPPEPLPELASLNRLFTTVASRATPPVVYVEVESDAEGFYARNSAGSGVIVSDEGYVITNDHVLQGGRRTRVVLDDKREYAAEVVGTDPTTDLAVLRLLEVGVDDEEPLPVARLGDSDGVQVGEWVLAVGSPFRLTGTVTQGIVSAVGRTVDIIQSDFRIEDFIQTDAPINQGNSGGALVNIEGEVVGIVTAIATDDQAGASQGYGFAVPSNLARRVTEDLIAYGEVRRGYIGIQVGEMTATRARAAGMTRAKGVLVENVYAGGPGARAGLQPGDVLLEIDGAPVDATNRFQSRVALARPADDVSLTVWREGERVRLSSALIARDDPSLQDWLASQGPAAPVPEAPSTADVPRSEAVDWGVRFRDLAPEEREQFGVAAGALVEAVQPESAAQADGLPEGMVVVEVEGTAVGTAAEAQVALDRLGRLGRSALLRVRRPDGLTAFYDLLTPMVE